MWESGREATNMESGIKAVWDQHFHWIMTMGAGEHKLYEAVLNDESSLFLDMTFQPDSIIGPFMEIEVIDDNGNPIRLFTDVPLELQSLTHAPYFFRIGPLEDGVAGKLEGWTVTIDPKYAEDVRVRLHEMIHVYEDMLERQDNCFREILLLALYNDLKASIPDLDRRVLLHAHALSQNEIIHDGGSHGVLFYLKSLDLDRKKGWPLGTTCGYGRDAMEEASD